MSSLGSMTAYGIYIVGGFLLFWGFIIYNMISRDQSYPVAPPSQRATNPLTAPGDIGGPRGMMQRK